MRVQNGNYAFEILEDGTKYRWGFEDDSPEPVLPEQMDLKITDWCDGGCVWCHESSTVEGKHGDVSAALCLLGEALPFTEIAIGGGDPLAHPQFEEFVVELDKMGLIPNVTVNGMHLNRHLAVLNRLTSKGVIRGVGVSYHPQMGEWDYKHKVIHVIAGVNPVQTLLTYPPSHLLILGYKNFGRGTGFYSSRVQSRIKEWTRHLPLLAQVHTLSFDTLAISQLYPQRLFKSTEEFKRRYMGDEGQFSMYVDAVTQTYGVSSYSDRRLPWHGLQAMFQNVRNELV